MQMIREFIRFENLLRSVHEQHRGIPHERSSQVHSGTLNGREEVNGIVGEGAQPKSGEDGQTPGAVW